MLFIYSVIRITTEAAKCKCAPENHNEIYQPTRVTRQGARADERLDDPPPKVDPEAFSEPLSFEHHVRSHAEEDRKRPFACEFSGYQIIVLHSSFAVDGPVVWNSLPAELRSPDISLDVFGKQLKTFQFNCW